MRAYELEESAVEELKNRLPKLKHHDYDTIDRLMQNISIKHKITGKKLHDMFVKKYGHTPDTWIKKIKNRLGEEDVAEVSDVPHWRVEQSKATGRYYVVTGYTDKSHKVWKSKQGAGDFNKKADAEAKAQELNQGVAEGHADQQRRIVKKNGHPVGEVGIDRESSPGVGKWYMKHYASGTDLSGYDSMEEALEELKHCLKQGVAEGIETVHGKKYNVDPDKYYVWAWDGAAVLYGEYDDIQDAKINLPRIEQRAIKRLGPFAKDKFEIANGKDLLRRYEKSGVAGGLNELAPAGGGGNIPRGPKTPSRGPWDDSGEDPYQLRRYNRSIDFFDQFDSEGVDKQKFDKATGEYEGYYFDRDAASGITQIAYFKFDDPTKIGDNDPGVGWYYEPVDEGVAEGTILPLKRPMSKVQHGKRTFPPTQRNVTEPEGNVTPIQKKSNQNQIGEEVTSSTDVQKIKDFVKWSQETLNIQKPYPRITLSKNTEKAQQGHHTGVHKGNDIWVYIGNRNLIDIFRTIFHELTHHRQMQLGMIEDGDSYPGSPIEMLADMAAGKYIKIYGKEHPEIFQ